MKDSTRDLPRKANQKIMATVGITSVALFFLLEEVWKSTEPWKYLLMIFL